MVLEKTPESHMDSRGVKPDNPKGNQPWIFIGRIDAEAEVLILWSPDRKSWLLGKDSDAGKDWWQEEKGVTEDEMVGWHHWLNEYEFKQTPGHSEGQRSLACCSSRGRSRRVGPDLATEQQQKVTVSSPQRACFIHLSWDSSQYMPGTWEEVNSYLVEWLNVNRSSDWLLMTS